MKFELGIGPDSWGVWFPDDPQQPPFEQFLDEASRAGYRTIELGPYGYLPTDPDALRSLLNAYTLRLSGGFIFGNLHSPSAYEERKAEIDSAAPLLQALGAEFCVLIESMYTDLFTGEQIADSELSEQEWATLVENSNRIGAYVSERYGLKAAFHPHAQTNIEREDQIERYLEMTDPELVSMCLDTGHHAYCGGDPVSFMRNHHDRIPYLHIKSVDQGIRAEVATEGIPFAEAVKLGAFTEPKAGVIDFVAFRQVLEDIGFEGIGIVEQDLYPTAFDRPYPIAVSTRRYLSDIGMAKRLDVVTSPISDVQLWQALDSRGNPTVAARVVAGRGVGDALAPAGASAGSHEAIFIRDGNASEYAGKSVRAHIEAVRAPVRGALIGRDADDPADVDRALRSVDTDPQLVILGGNVGTAVSIAAWLAAADDAGEEPWRWLARRTGATPSIPLPMVNIISGGAHAGSMIDIQDVLVVPVGAESFAQAIEWCWSVRAGTRAVLDDLGFTTALVADEGGLAAPFETNERAIEAVVDGITRAGFSPGEQVAVALDVAATECQAPGGYRMGGETLTSAQFVDRVIGWRRDYPIVSIEDGAGEDDDEGWSRIATLVDSTQILGDDRYVTTVTRLDMGIERAEANSVLVKPNQAGTLEQALRVVQRALSVGWAPVASARSGETEETWLADLATGTGAGQIKVGSTMRSERTAKWNRLLYLEQAHHLPYAGAAALAPRT